MLLLVAAAPVLGVVAEVAGEVEPPPGDAVGVEHVRGLGRVRHPAGATIIRSSCHGHNLTWCLELQTHQ